jgi:DNA invertase Pin-like site-specific DNA recombinase
VWKQTHHGRSLYIAYLRVSTDRQDRSGLGLEAQRQAVADFLNGRKWTLAGEFVEVETGKNNDRPQLANALATCRLTRATTRRRQT